MITESLDENYNIKDVDIFNFNKYLSDYQMDITRLLQSKRKFDHKLSIEEIVSDFNLNLIKNRDKIIKFRTKEYTEFSEASFHYLMCIFAKNMVFWLDYREKNKPYVSRRVDRVKYHDGVMYSTFDFISELKGEEDLMDFDDSNKFIMTVNHIKSYYDWFTESELELIDYLMKDMNQLDISKIRNCSHQAISASVKALKQKIQGRIKYSLTEDVNWEFIRKGNKSIQDLFAHQIVL